MRRGEKLTGMLTREEQQQKDLPYGHGIGIAYYHTVAGQKHLAKQTLSSLIAYQPEKYGADVELARLYMSLKQYKTALRSIEELTIVEATRILEWL